MRSGWRPRLRWARSRWRSPQSVPVLQPHLSACGAGRCHRADRRGADTGDICGSLASTGSLLKAFGAAAASVTGAGERRDDTAHQQRRVPGGAEGISRARRRGGRGIQRRWCGLETGSVRRCDPERAHQHSRRTRSAGRSTDHPDRRHQHIASGVGRGDQRCDGGGISGGRAPFGRRRPDRRRRSAGTCAIRNPGSALAARHQATQTLATAGGIVRDAVHTALTNVRDSLADPFPSTARVAATKADPPAALAAGRRRTVRHATQRPRSPRMSSRTRSCRSPRRMPWMSQRTLGNRRTASLTPIIQERPPRWPPARPQWRVVRRVVVPTTMRRRAPRRTG